MKRILCLWLPNWPIQRVTASGPAGPRRPLLLAGRDSRRGQIVMACCERSARQGVSPGQPLTEALALWERPASRSEAKRPRGAPPRDVQPYAPELDRLELLRLARWCEAFSPVVGLEQVTTGASPRPQRSRFKSSAAPREIAREPASLLLDTSGVTARWGGEWSFAQRILAGLAEQGYQGRVGLADTLGAAWALAHYGDRCQGDGDQGDDQAAIYIAAAGATRDALARLPVAALRLAPITLKLLHELGIQTIAELLALPRAGLAMRLGDELLWRLAQAFGECPEPIVTPEPEIQLQARWEAESPTTRRAEWVQVVRHLCQHLAELLAAQQQGALQLTCRWTVVEGAAGEFSIGLFRPTAQADSLWQLLRYQLESVQIAQPITRITLTATATSSLTKRQGMLWDQTALSDPAEPSRVAATGEPFSRLAVGESAALGDLIERLSNRLGPEVVGGVRLRAGKLPEAAYALIPLTGPHAVAARRRAAGPAIDWGPTLRPLVLFAPPLPIQVVRAAPHGPLVSFTHDRQTQHVTACWGPERMETCWWRGPTVRRDYYRVRCDSGARFWLYHHLTAGTWFLHGSFS